jgi:copper chaperone NosL
MKNLTDFFQGQLSLSGRALLLAAALAMVPCIFLPTWKIQLHAPQYPDGLEMQIYPTTVRGDVREINILNHYIGMHQIDAAEFPEFRFIPFFILRFVGFAMLTVLVARMPIAALGWMDFVLFGVVMLYTFQHWLFEYGQNLAPDAPLRIDAFTPKFIGTTQVGQFSVSSWPASGAILMGVAGMLGPVIALVEWRRFRRSPKA